MKRQQRAYPDLVPDRDFIRSAFFGMWRPPDPRPASQWIRDNVRIPFSSQRQKIDLDLTPYLEEPLDYAPGTKILNGHRVKIVTVQAAVQSAKSTLQEAFACWIIDQDPGPLMWNFQSDPDAKEAAETRIHPIWKATAAIARLLPGGDRQRTLMVIFDRMFAIIQGAQTKLNLQQKSIRWVLNDEIWLWPQGHLAEAYKRVTSYWNSMIFNVTTGSVKDQDADVAFRAGDMREWSFRCDKCGLAQPFHLRRRDENTKLLKKGGVSWNDDTLTRGEDGEWIHAEIAKSVRYECDNVDCDRVWSDSALSRKSMNKKGSGHYVALNKNPEPGNVSFHWNAFCVPWISWADVVAEFLKANDAAHTGVMTPLQEFVQKRLGEAWEVRGVEEKVSVPSSEYYMGTGLDDRRYRFMTVDVQSDHFWIVVRDWDAAGNSRLVWTGRVQTWDDVRTKQLELQVYDRSVAVDASWGQASGGPRANYYQCCLYGWFAMEGSSREYFPRTSTNAKTKKTITRRSPISKLEKGDPLTGAKRSDGMNVRKMRTRCCPLLKWSNPAVKDILESLSRGRGTLWEVPKDTPEFWHEHMRSEVKRTRPNKDTGVPEVEYVRVGKRQVHTRDCECMQIVFAIYGRVLGGEGGGEEEDQKPE